MKLTFITATLLSVFAAPLDVYDVVEEGVPTVLTGGGLLPFTAADWVGHSLVHKAECDALKDSDACVKNYKCFWDKDECEPRKSFLSVMAGYESSRCFPAKDATSCQSNKFCKWYDNSCCLDKIHYMNPFAH